jgi:hypothetical protein
MFRTGRQRTLASIATGTSSNHRTFTLHQDSIETPRGTFALTPDVHARLEHGDKPSVTLTRVLTLGIFALAAAESRKSYLTIAGADFVDGGIIDTQQRPAAMRFVTEVTMRVKQLQFAAAA